jgi:UPF0755 protein
VVSKKTLLITAFILVIIVVPALFCLWYQAELQPVVMGSVAGISFTVSPNESAASVLEQLKGNSLIRSVLATKIYLRISNLGNKIRQGTYTLDQGKSVSEIISILNSGPHDIWVTIPEGWRREQIAARLAGHLKDVNKNFNSSDFIKNTASLEGRLFPDTYLIPPSAGTADVIDIMTANFRKKSGLGSVSSDQQILILASLVEREAKSDSDRQNIAAILKKRLEAGWPLQVDASVQYSMDNRICAAGLINCNWWKNPIDTKYPSAFNTYLHPGLPPAPICNPGLATINAVKDASGSAYWYYMTGTDGITRYARDLAGHKSNIDKYLH